MKRSNLLSKRRQKELDTPPQWLICCEGKSEVVYLSDLIDCLSEQYAPGKKHGIKLGLKGRCDDKRLQGECGRQHMALAHRAELCSKGHQFDQVWVLFDLDANGENAKELAKNFEKAVAYLEESSYLIPGWSVPCFEYWLACHGKDFMDCGDSAAVTRKVKALLETDANKHLYCNKKYQNRKGETHCELPKPHLCGKLLDKPYYNSFQALGKQAGAERAMKASQKAYEKANENHDLDHCTFKDVSCCSNLHLLVHELIEYFKHL